MTEIPLKFLDIGLVAPEDDSFHLDLALDRYVVKNPSSTFYMQVKGNAHQALNIFNGDILVVDRACLPRKNKIIITNQERELKIMQFKSDLDYESEYWGLATHLIRKL